MEYSSVEIPSVSIVPKLQIADSYLEVSRPKEIETLLHIETELQKRKHPHFNDFYTITHPETFLFNTVPNPASPFNKYYNVTELQAITSKRLPIVSPSALLFPQLPDFKKETLRVLNIINRIHYIDAAGLLLYRQSNLNIHITKKDEYHVLGLPEMKQSPSLRKPLVFGTYTGTIPAKHLYDVFIVNLDFIEYKTIQSHLGIVSQLIKILKKGGCFLYNQQSTYLKITNDFFHILSHMFDSVQVVQLITPYKTVVCTGFRANESFERVLQEMSEAWNPDKIVQRLVGGTPEIKSIQMIQKQELLISIQRLQEIEERIKTPEQIPLYIEEAKVKAKRIYDLMKIRIPISLLFKSTDLKAMFHQPSNLNLIIRRSTNTDRINHSDLYEFRNRIEIDLFSMKREIDYVANQNQYSKITDLFKITNRVLKYPSRKIIGQSVSQAFLKMCEILHETELVNKKTISVFHLCEAPGQFILAFRHYCNHKRVQYLWEATSLKKRWNEELKKYEEEGLGDDYGLIKKYPKQWIWGADGTGDIMHIENIRGFAKKQYDIVTSDCGWPMEDFGFQEEDLLQINHGQLTAMLMCLKVGGNCVFKTFLPIMFPLSLSLFYILYMHFEKIVYFKPSLNPSSSEIYVLGIHFKGISKRVEDALCDLVQKFNPDRWLFETFEKDFIKFHTEAIQTCIENTKRSMIRSILMYHFYNPKEHIELLEKIQRKDGDEWIRKYLLFGKRS
jgi:hypothetical protein